MKKLKLMRLSIITIFGLFTFIACSSMKPISYSFLQDEINSASINFIRGNPGVTFVSFNESRLPEAEEGTYWNPIVFPSGVPLEITVHAFYYQTSSGASGGLLVTLIADVATSGIRNNRSVDNEVIFLCPPLEAGREYRLSFEKGYGMPGKNTLVLTDVATKKNVYQQVFEIN